MENVVTIEYLYTNPITKKDLKIYATIPKIDIDTQIGEIYHQQCYRPPKKHNKVIFDVGANIGLASLYFQPYAERIYAFEPNPVIFPCLVENTKKFKNITCINAGFYNMNGLMYMYGKKDEIPQSFVEMDGWVSRVPAKVMRIDDFMKNNNIEHVDYMKVDIEGGEYYLFMDEAFEAVAKKIDAICGEAHHTDNGMIPDLVPVILKTHGFKTKFKKSLAYNYTKGWTYTRSDHEYFREYRIKMWTIFLAKRYGA